MMRHVVASVALVIGEAGLLLGAATGGPADFVRVKVAVANVRSGPGTETDRLLVAYRNEPLQVIARRSTWLQVLTFDGRRGWIHRPLTDGKAAVVVNDAKVNMRAGPGTDHEILFTAERGTCFVVLGQKGPWLDVEHDNGDRGWIHGSLVWGD